MMQTILRILERAGGYRPTLYLKIENPPYMALVIEAVPERGLLNLPAISVAHYGGQIGDLMRDPEMCLALSTPPLCAAVLSAYYYRNDYMGIEKSARRREGNDYIFAPELYEQLQRFAELWDRNLRDQHFPEAFTDR